MLSDEAILQEIHFNYGKTFSELKLFHLAEKHYKLALTLADKNPWLLPEKYFDKNKDKNKNNNNNNNVKNDNINFNDNLSINKNSKASHANENKRISSFGNNMNTPSTTQGQSQLHVTREAAHNLVLIYKKSGARDHALEIMQKYLVF